MGDQTSRVVKKIKGLFGANLKPKAPPTIEDDPATGSQLGLTASELAVWDAYSYLLEGRDTSNRHYIDISQLPAPKHEIGRIIKKAILHLSDNSADKEALNVCVLGFLFLANCQDIQSFEPNEEAAEGLRALEQLLQASSLPDKETVFHNAALTHLFGPLSQAEMSERLTEMKQFFRENNLVFPS